MNTPVKPQLELTIAGNKRVPANAPHLPPKAEIPWYVLRTCAGKQSAGKTYVPKFGPKFKRTFSISNNANCTPGFAFIPNATAMAAKFNTRSKKPQKFIRLQPH